MINLLPDENKKVIRAGRMNRLLMRYVFLSGIALGVLLVVMMIAWLLLDNIKQSAQARIDNSGSSNTTLANDVVAMNNFRQNLSRAKQILDSQINYSGVILRYASAIPKGVVIDKLDLDPTIVGKQITFTANVKDSESVLSLKESLTGSPYFDDVHFTEISSDAASSAGYAFTVQISVTVNRLLIDGDGS